MVRRSEQPSGVPKEPKQAVHTTFSWELCPVLPPPSLAFSPRINSPTPAEPLTSQPGQPQAMGPFPETWIIISLLLLLSSAGLWGGWVGAWSIPVQRSGCSEAIGKYSIQTGRISAAVGRENLAAEMLFGGQQGLSFWGQHEQVHVSAAFTAHQYDDVLVNLRAPEHVVTQIQSSASLSWLGKCCSPSLWRFQEGSAWCSGREGCGRQMESRWVLVLQAGCLQAGRRCPAQC